MVHYPVAILILRKIDPNRERPFKVPFCPWFPLLGILCCGGLMIYSMVIAKGQAAVLSTELFLLWVVAGMLIYAGYGYRKNRKAEQKAAVDKGVTKTKRIFKW